MISDNLFAHVDQSGGPDACWPFMRSINSGGYGTVWVDGRVEQAHRHAYTVAVGPIPDGPDGKTLHILHSCDNPACCNPRHLRAGTSKENMCDRETRGRGRQPRGEENKQSKLKTKDVIFIRRCRDIYNSTEMAAMLGVHRTHVCHVLAGEVWAHVVDLKREDAV